jgi:hypothetical protein
MSHVDEISLAKENAWFQGIQAAVRKLTLLLK